MKNIILFLLLAVLNSLGTDYFVHPGGKSTWPGTSRSSPWDLQTAFSFTGYANGDNVYIEGIYNLFTYDEATQSYYPNGLTFGAQAGAGNTVTWQPYRGSFVTIGCSKITISGSSGNHTFKDIGFTAQTALAYHKTDASERLVFWDGSVALDRFSFINCRFYAMQQAFGNITVNVRGCAFFAVGATAFEHCFYGGGGSNNKLINNLFMHTGGEAIKFAPTSTTTSPVINSNIIINAGTFASPAGPSYGALIGPGSVSVTGLEFKDNFVLSDMYGQKTADDFPVFLPCYASTAIAGMTISGNRFEGPDSTIFKLGTASGNTVSSLVISGNTFAINNAGGGFSRPIFYIFATQTGATVNNNAYYNYGGSTARFQYPDGVGYTDFASWKSGSGFDASSTFTPNAFPPDTYKILKNHDQAGWGNVVFIQNNIVGASTIPPGFDRTQFRVTGVDVSGLGLISDEDFIIGSYAYIGGLSRFSSTFRYTGSTVTIDPPFITGFGAPSAPASFGVTIPGNPVYGIPPTIKNHADFTMPTLQSFRYCGAVIRQAQFKPVSPAVSSPSAGLVRVTWTIPSGNNFSKFIVYRRILPSGAFVKINELPFTSNRYDDATAQAGVSYEYKVQTWADFAPNAGMSTAVQYTPPSNPTDPETPPTWIPGATEYDPARIVTKPKWWEKVETFSFDE